METIRTNIRPHTVKGMADRYAAAKDEFYSNVNQGQLLVFRELINKQFSDLSSKIKFHFVDDEPYGENPKIDRVLMDFYTGYLPIHTTGNDSKVWGKFHNLQFRAIHDYIHCLHAIEFSHMDEINAYKKQMEFSFGYAKDYPCLNWDIYNKILRSEIVYQSAYKEAYGKFHIDQKIILQDL